MASGGVRGTWLVGGRHGRTCHDDARGEQGGRRVGAGPRSAGADRVDAAVRGASRVHGGASAAVQCTYYLLSSIYAVLNKSYTN